MNGISEEQIDCVFDGHEEVPIFDHDDWCEEGDPPFNSTKSLPIKVNTHKCQTTLTQRIDQEL